jgi:hypothetical protein
MGVPKTKRPQVGLRPGGPEGPAVTSFLITFSYAVKRLTAFLGEKGLKTKGKDFQKTGDWVFRGNLAESGYERKQFGFRGLRRF